jgi:hypothetical protein
MPPLQLYFESDDTYRNGISQANIDYVSKTVGSDPDIFFHVNSLFSQPFGRTKGTYWEPAKRDQFYFYPISCEYPLKHFADRNLSGYALIHVPDYVVDDCVEGNAGIIIYDNWESESWTDYTRMILDVCENNPRLRIEHFIVVSGNLNPISNLPFKHVNQMWFQSIDQESNIDTIIEDIKSLKQRPHKFIMMARRPSQGRLAMVYKMWGHKQGNLMSFDLGPKPNAKFILEHLPACLPDYNKAKLSKIKKELPLIIDDGLDVKTNPVHDASFDKFLNSYLHIVNETFYGDQHKHQRMFFSEKTFKPMQMLQPFVIYNYPHSLEFLRQQGYQTFDKWIDESYDLIEDIPTRITAITDAAKEFISKTPEELALVLKDMLPVLKHNARHRAKNVRRMDEDLLHNLVNTFHNDNE